MKISVRKRVRRERRIVATKRDGLLVDSEEMQSSGPKVPPEDVIAAVAAEPGLSVSALAVRLGVARGTVRTYLAGIPEIVQVPGRHGAMTCHLADGGGEATARLLPGQGVDNVAGGRQVDIPATLPSTRSDESEDELLEQLRDSGA